MTKRTGRREAKCSYCSKEILTGITVCSDCLDLVQVEAEVLAICTVSDDCTAAPDGHLPECPVEQRLRAELGF